MTRSQVATLLAMCASFDRRTVGEADVVAWFQLLGDTRFEDARDAVLAHYGESHDWLMPVDVLTGVRKIRRARHDAATDPIPPADLTVAEAIAWLRAARRQIGDGTWQQETPALTRDMPVIENTFRRP